jgi:hypothetical protein
VCEPFCFHTSTGEYRDSCKTRGLAYDGLVEELLYILRVYGYVYDVSCDGDREDREDPLAPEIVELIRRHLCAHKIARAWWDYRAKLKLRRLIALIGNKLVEGNQLSEQSYVPDFYAILGCKPPGPHPAELCRQT